MRILALDISSKTGWAHLDSDASQDLKILDKGLIELGQPILGFGQYPWCYVRAAREQVSRISKLVADINPDVIVVEETNLGKSRYAQKFLEFLHCQFIEAFNDTTVQVAYISSSAWRKALELGLSAEDRRNNRKLSQAKRFAHHTGQKLDKKALGVKGRVNKKHIAVRYVNETYGLNFKMKDNDIADAICLGTAYLAGAEVCDGQ